MTWEELLLEDMSRYVSRKLGKDVVVTSFDYEDEGHGGCETCGPNPAQVLMFYAVGDKTRCRWYYGSLGELLDELRQQ